MDIENIIEQELNKILSNNKYVKEKAEKVTIPIYKTLEKKIKKKILIMSGGGIKGVAHIGALQALENMNLLENINTFAATSIGSLIVSMYIIGYKPDELWDFIKEFEFSNLKSINITNLLKQYGLDSGIKIEYLIQRLIKAKGYDEKITMKELYEITKKKLIISTVCLNKQSVEYLSYDKYPDLSLYEAIRMSISIPGYYVPKIYKNEYYIDGGCIDNYPIHLYNDKLEKVIGIYLNESKKDYIKINNLEEYLKTVLFCFMEGATYNSKKGYDKYTIDINLESINAIDYGVSLKEKEYMYNIGYKKTMEFIENMT